MITFALPSAKERHSNTNPRLDKLQATKAVAFTAIRHNQLWFHLVLYFPTDETRDKLGKYFVSALGTTFVYVLDNSYAFETL